MNYFSMFKIGKKKRTSPTLMNVLVFVMLYALIITTDAVLSKASWSAFVFCIFP